MSFLTPRWTFGKSCKARSKKNSTARAENNYIKVTKLLLSALWPTQWNDEVATERMRFNSSVTPIMAREAHLEWMAMRIHYWRQTHFFERQGSILFSLLASLRLLERSWRPKTHFLNHFQNIFVKRIDQNHQSIQTGVAEPRIFLQIGLEKNLSRLCQVIHTAC